MNTAMVVVTPERKEAAKQQFNYDNVQVYDNEEDATVKGALGNPIFMPLKLERTTYQIQRGNETKAVTIGEMLLPIAILELSRVKNMAMTEVEGLDGTIKEYGSKGDWHVTVRGMLYNDNDTYPEKELKHLLEFDDCPVAVEVACDLFSYTGIKKLTLNSIRIVPTPEFEDMQAFEIDAVQDAPNYELIKRKS